MMMMLLRSQKCQHHHLGNLPPESFPASWNMTEQCSPLHQLEASFGRQWRHDWLALNVTEWRFNQSPSKFFSFKRPSPLHMQSMGCFTDKHVKQIPSDVLGNIRGSQPRRLETTALCIQLQAPIYDTALMHKLQRFLLISSSFLPSLHVAHLILFVEQRQKRSRAQITRGFCSTLSISQILSENWGCENWRSNVRTESPKSSQTATNEQVWGYVTMMVVTTTVRFSITELSLDRAFSFWTNTSLSMSFQ